MHSRARIKVLFRLSILIILSCGVRMTTGESLNETSSEVENTLESSELPVVNSTAPRSSSESTEMPVVETTQPVMMMVTQESTETVPTTTTTTSTAYPSSNEIPPDKGLDRSPNCSQFPLSSQQPVYDKNSLINKCCPFGQIFQQDDEGRLRCTPGERKIDVETIYAVFYGDSECIEDKENKLHFNYDPNDSCLGNNMTFQYSKEQGDELFVIQNGSLLVLENGGFMSVFDQYCIEVDTNSRLLAKACDDIEPVVLKSTAALIYAGMMMASVALLVTCLAYALIPKLNDVFGYLLAGHSGTFLVGLIMMTLAVCGDRCVAREDVAVVQIFAQIFLMSSVFTFLLMNVYNYVYAAYYLPNGLEFDTKSKKDVFIFLGVLYTITLLPLFLPWKHSLIFHLILYIYYLAIATVLYLSHRALRTLADSKFIRFTVSNQSYHELTYTEAVNAQPRLDRERLKELSSVNRLCTVETVFTFICWVLFSSLQRNTDSNTHVDIYRICTAYAIIFQGLLIGVLFVGGRKKWTIIRECWHNSGSIDLRAMEMDREMKTLDRKTPLL
ncbi:uncharacterized protein LOC129771722 [Toxorhynchites rutilus septentrionalis]|uniref:uncharacterized protein LOC129771722 n=1 Tax=Toxorhynchites rutilus septentrionalis TaxID=329112 RepID=UPI0024788650|nr:uncharacterized protein LOC129771722 [Toxorhynchites rutilus septentrionalis]